MLDPGARKRNQAMRTILNILEDTSLLEWAQEAIKKFWRHVDAQDQLKVNTKRGYMQTARVVLKRVECPPVEWTEDTIIKLMQRFRRKENGSDYAAQYRNQVRVVVLQLMICFERDDLYTQCKMTKRPVGKVMKMQRIRGFKDKFDVDLQVTEEQMKAIMSQVNHFYVKTLFWVLWDTGARIDDLRMMTLKDVDWDEEGTGVILNVPQDTKTGHRVIRPRYSLGMFRSYMAEHPYAQRFPSGSYKSLDMPVFLNSRGYAWSGPSSVGLSFKRACTRVRRLQSGPDWPFPAIPAHITVKYLRTSAVNRDREEGMDVEDNALHHGHTLAVMQKFYRKANKKARIIHAVDRLAGRAYPEEKKERASWRTCPKCHHQTSPTNDYCANCGEPVTPAAMRTREKDTASRERRIAEMALEMLMKEGKDRGLIP